MASKATGYQGASLVETRQDFDPQTGELYTEIWRGSKAAILAKTAEFRDAGWKIQRQKWSGPGYQVTASIGVTPSNEGGKSTEAPVDRWRIATQLAQFDLRSNPKLLEAARAETLLETGIAFTGLATPE